MNYFILFNRMRQGTKLRNVDLLALLLSLIIIASLTRCQNSNELQFTVADQSWEPGLGNHRAIMQIKNPSEVVRLQVDWRRRDRSPESRRFMIIHSNTNDLIPIESKKGWIFILDK